jgi:hypothetical protein
MSGEGAPARFSTERIEHESAALSAWLRVFRLPLRGENLEMRERPASRARFLEPPVRSRQRLVNFDLIFGVGLDSVATTGRVHSLGCPPSRRTKSLRRSSRMCRSCTER